MIQIALGRWKHVLGGKIAWRSLPGCIREVEKRIGGIVHVELRRIAGSQSAHTETFLNQFKNCCEVS